MQTLRSQRQTVCVLYFDEDYTEPHPEHKHTDSDGVQSQYLYKHLDKVWHAIEGAGDGWRWMYITCSTETV